MNKSNTCFQLRYRFISTNIVSACVMKQPQPCSAQTQETGRRTSEGVNIQNDSMRLLDCTEERLAIENKYSGSTL